MIIKAGGKYISEPRQFSNEADARAFVEGELEKLYPGKWKAFNSSQYGLKEQELYWWEADVIGYVWVFRNEREILEQMRDNWKKKADDLRSLLAEAESNVIAYQQKIEDDYAAS